MVDTDAIRALHHKHRGQTLDGCTFCSTLWPCPTIQLCDALDVLREENTRLREMVEGKFDTYDRDGEPVLPRGWVPVDGGRLDELEAAEAENTRLRAAGAWQEGVETAVCFVNGCDYIDIDPRGPVWVRGDPTPHYACAEHWEAIFRILGHQASSDDAQRWEPVA